MIQALYNDAVQEQQRDHLAARMARLEDTQKAVFSAVPFVKGGSKPYNQLQHKLRQELKIIDG